MKYIDHQKQFGFKKNSSCNHAIFVLLQALHYSKIRKMCLYTIAIDFSKAFDKVNREYLWCKHIEYGIDPAIIRAIIIYYAISEIKTDWVKNSLKLFVQQLVSFKEVSYHQDSFRSSFTP